LELRPDLEDVPPLFAQTEIAAQARRLSRLALPAIAVVIGRGNSELSRGSVHPSGRVQGQLLGGVEALLVRINQEFGFARNCVPERMPSAPQSGVVFRPAGQLCQQIVTGWRGRHQRPTLVTK